MTRLILWIAAGVVMALTLGISVTLSATGWFEQFPALLLFGFGAAAVGIAFMALYLLEHLFHRKMPIRSLRFLTYGQTLRFFGTLAYWKAEQHILPAMFAIPTAVMDDALAISAFYVARHCITDGGKPTRGFFLWHIAGLASLAISNVLVVLTASPRSGGVTSQAMASFPMSIVPTWIGPMVLMFHLLALYEGRRGRVNTSAVL
ncbi:MAG TPA: hypothetical protein VHC72_10300 [Bryobacteraceae bacterium]|nr:hypothetical protein [Bryobacteraceae bacterium]